jgi:hypothetical protein
MSVLPGGPLSSTAAGEFIGAGWRGRQMRRKRRVSGARKEKGPAMSQALSILARPERFELPTPWFVARYSIQLSYGREARIIAADLENENLSPQRRKERKVKEQNNGL